MKSVKNRNLGNIEVSEIGMGCMALSHGYGQIPEHPYSVNAIRAAFEYGCTFFDTAEAYGAQLYYEGHNEEILGEALKDVRKDAVIATKFHVKPEDYAKGADVYAAIKGHLVKSMNRLGTDYVDLYYLHRVDEHVPVEDVAGSMGKLMQEGLIRGWGLSQVDVETLRKAHEVTPVSAVQNLYNILERDCEADIFPYCLEHNIGVVPFSPIASGLLSGKITTSTEFEKVDDVRSWVPQLTKENIQGNQPIVDILRTYAAQKNATPAQVSLAWMLHKYPNVVPIPGSKNRERILENLGAGQVNFTDGEFTALEMALSNCKIYGHRGHVEIAGKGFLNTKPLR